MLKKNFKIFLFLVLLFLLGANFVYALEIIYPRIPGAVPPQDFLKTALPEDILSLYAKYLVNLAIWAGGILTLAGLIYGGILYLLSTGKPQRMASAKDQITAAFFGLLLLLSSFLILKTLGPQFINLKIPTLKQVQIPQKPVIPLPETTAINSSIETEMPFSRVIEKIFETYIADYPTPEIKKEPRITEIKNNVTTTEEIAGKLLNQSENLKTAASSCSCEILRPDPPCNHYGCQDCPPKYCTCDPCKNVRGKIQDNEDKNKTEINNLTKEQIKTEEQVRLLKEWLERLKRTEKFIKECPLRSLSSLTQFYSKKDSFDKNNWVIRETNFWDDISIRYYTGQYTKDQYGSWYYVPTKEIATDFATFYCSVSGTLEQEYPFPAESKAEKLTGEESAEEAEDVLSEKMACSKEAPVGEIIDRTKRTTQFLIDKLELLVSKDKELIDAVDKLQVLVSQCSSQRCVPKCICVSCGYDCSYCQEIGCFGEACPIGEINKQFDEIKRIQEEIKNIIEGEKGIIFIIDEIIPEILNDLEWNIRKPIKECSNLFNCQQAKGAVIPPTNQVLRTCCKTEDTVYGDCFQECFLEIGQEKHRECVQKCLDGLAIMLDDPEIAQCTHELNFYCCP